MIATQRVLIIDDEIEVGTFFKHYFQEIRSMTVSVGTSGKEARQLLSSGDFDLALIDLKLPDTDGITLMKEIKQQMPQCEAIIMTGYSTIRSAVDAMRYGAFDYVDKPFDDLKELDAILDRAFSYIRSKKNFVRSELESMETDYGIVMDEDSPLKEILVLARKIAGKKITVLLEGETGTGKEVMARYIHACSPRSGQPFIAINCGALSESLLESELFGHEKGAFTGATTRRRGVFEIANYGTLFLDEIGDASPAIQLKLLRILETGEFYRVGGETVLKTDVRVIAASNRNLRQAVQDKLFREDLLYRLDVVSFNLPPLRERPMDILPLSRYYVQKNLTDKTQAPVFTGEAMAFLQSYAWPGNIRELSNVIARAVLMREGNEMGIHCLPGHIIGGNPNQPLPAAPKGAALESYVQEWGQNLIAALRRVQDIDLLELTRILEEQTCKISQILIEDALAANGNDPNKAAEKLHIKPRALRYLKNEKGKLD